MSKFLHLLRVIVLTVVALATSMTATYSHAQTLDKQVLTEKRLTFGIHNRWPWGIATKDGGVSGIYPDVLKAVVAQLGVKKVDFVVMDFGALIPSLLARRIDVVASGMNITPPRCQQVAFSDPFQASGDAVLVKSGNPFRIHSYEDIVKNKEIRVGDIRGASTTPNALAAGLPKDRLQLFQDNEAGLAALISNRIDAMLFASGTVVGMLRDPNVRGIERATPFTGLVENGVEKMTYGAFEFRKEDSDFIAVFDKALDQKKADGTVAKIIASYGFSSKADLAPVGLTVAKLCGR